MVASSMAPRDVNNTFNLLETIYYIPDSSQLTSRKGGDTEKAISIPVETFNYFIVGQAHNTFVGTRSIAEMEDTLIGSTCTLKKTLENCMQCKLEVIDIQTEHCANSMTTTQ